MRYLTKNGRSKIDIVGAKIGARKIGQSGGVSADIFASALIVTPAMFAGGRPMIHRCPIRPPIG